jgi:hypothetical protein
VPGPSAPWQRDGRPLVAYAYLFDEKRIPAIVFVTEWQYGEHRGATAHYILMAPEDLPGGDAKKPSEEIMDLLSTDGEISRRIAEGSMRRLGELPALLVDAPSPSLPLVRPDLASTEPAQ